MREQGPGAADGSATTCADAQVCSNLNVMYARYTIERGPVADLYRAPAHPYTRLLLAATPDIVDITELVSIKGAPPALNLGDHRLPVRSCCYWAFDRCGAQTPALKTVGENRMAACHLNHQVPGDIRRR